MSDALRLANPLNLQRLTIGVTNANGERAALVFEKSETAPCAPLTPVLDEPAPAETPAPTERELNEMYLVARGWTKTTLDGINVAWEAPTNGGAMPFENALYIQLYRDDLAARAQLPALCAVRDYINFNVRVVVYANVTVAQLQNGYFNRHDVRSMTQDGPNVTVEFYR